ncbi:alcohol dehydrogenase catalytic domain-containing protein [Streptomyces luteolifulvus]|uniref:alcohol dehydrogenase n=1 Tax=Streptomyces luteolifulvus TaxID=2615112 RepID=A0A6H9UNG9_9ACTN|nr:alcohol dehydrogenase catalytic domain-containing protein [Streptomyces luteolifulvus]KAB1139646.1 alcohol dehydrogenase catalytic domain-containing protein [Streptomyces luteolifulvus]
MKALVIHEFGGPDVLRLEEMPNPEPAAGEVQVRVSAAIVARTKDVAARAGKPPFAPQIPELPHVLGAEHAGVVDAVGSGVDHRLIGKRVSVSAVLSCGDCRACRAGREEACASFSLIGVHRHGSYAEYCTAPVANVRPLPDDIDFVEAAAMAANGPVARAQLEAGGVGRDSTVLVVGAAGALGSTVAALAAHRGAQVIGVDRLAAKPGCLDALPLTTALDGDSPDLAQQIRAAGGSWGIDCVVDNLGLPVLWNAYRDSIADMGKIIVSGAVSHAPISMHLLPFYLHSQSLIGVRTGNRQQMDAFWQDVTDGFRLPGAMIHGVSWEAAADAHRTVENGTSLGQAVLLVGA